jgi:predicted RecB family nuclease
MAMPPQITADVLEAFLHCRYKGHLKQAGQMGTPCGYEVLADEQRATVRQRAIEQITARQADVEVLSAVPLTAPTLKQGMAFVLEATLEDNAFSLRFDGLKRVDGPSKLGDYHYVPVLFHGGESVRKEQRLFLDVCGLLLSRIQGRTPGHGIVWHGRECRAMKVRLSPDPRKAELLLRDLQQPREAGPPRLVLNDHCQVCEFRRRCHDQAVQEDNLSLLRGLGEREVRAYARKGILNLTQLAHTFRPRRKGKRSVRLTHHRYHALQALAIRDKRVYLFGTPEVADAPVRIYLDIEGVPDEGFVYLIGMTVVEDGSERHLSFWADSRDEESVVFERFLAEVGKYPDARLYCYGSYERGFLKRMRKTAIRKGPVDRVLAALVNVLSVVYAHVYFPCHSNGLKDVAGCLGFSWNDPESSGVQSIVWRKRWEHGRAEAWKAKLETYNREDCAALRLVTEFLLATGAPSEAAGPRHTGGSHPTVASVEELDRLGAVSRRGKIEFFHPDFEHINGCGRFDYQREKVYVRSGKRRRRKGKKVRRWANRGLRVSQQVQIVARRCPSCGGSEVIPWEHGNRATGKSPKHKKSFDLVFTPGGIKRKVIECRTRVHECRACGTTFIPDRYVRLAKHFHGLKSWAIYEHVAHRIPCPALSEMLREFFGLSVCYQEVNAFKEMMARYYRPCYKRLLAKVLSGPALHVDETEVKLRTGKGYVWVFTTAEEVVYMCRSTREGDFLPELLKDFRGVLVTDFYAAYDALPCPQQKCLIHLIRDMNQDLLNNPFDAELQSITGPFGVLLRAVVEDIDRHGLKQRFLGRHERAVDAYFRSLDTLPFQSEAAEALRTRLIKNRDKLFTFIRHDGVPWNNNNAENAIRRLAYYREANPGRLREAGLNDYLVLLSVCHTCRYKGVSFLKFLLSRERDMDSFCLAPSRRRAAPVVEVYPKGVERPDFGSARRRTSGDGTPSGPARSGKDGL